MRESSNPILRNLKKEYPGGNRQYAGFGPQSGQFGSQFMGQPMPGQQVGGQQYGQPYGQSPTQYPQTQAPSRSITVDDIVTKTGITLGVLTIAAIASYFLSMRQPGLATILLLVGAFGGLGLVLYATFARKMDSPGIVIAYAVLEGLAVGAISFVFANFAVSGVSAGVLIGQAVLGTFGVFFGMLIVYKTGAIRVTPRLTRMLFAAMIGVMVLSIGNLILFMITGANPLRGGGMMSIIFSLVCIGIAAFTFLIDFDSADELIRAGAPERAAWGVALSLTITLVWLYIEILRLLSYFNRN